MKNRPLLLYASGLLLFLNLWLLYTNMERQEQIEFLNAEVQKLNLENEQSTKSWSFEAVGENPARLIHPGVPQAEQSVSLSVFFTDKGCSYCVEYEVQIINKLYEKYKNKLRIYLLSHNDTFLKRLYDAEFPYKNIDPEKKLLDNDFDFSNPIALVTDENRLVQLIHIAEQDNEEKSHLFYTRISSLLESL